MNFDLTRYFRIFREGMMQVVRRYPVELALAVYAAAVWAIAYELPWAQGYCRAAVVPLFFALALMVNRLADGGPWRRVYRVIWVLLVPLSLWTGLNDWVGETQYLVTLCVLAPLAVLLCQRATGNERFVSDAVVWLRSALLAELFANVALGLFAAILYSTVYIFGCEGAWADHVWMYAVILSEAVAAPVLFLMMAERWHGAKIVGNRILSVLLDYIVAPALLIYTAILYLYALKIVVTWSLPEGGVAYLVFGFTMTALAVKALQLLLERRRYDWFFDRFSLVSLPLLVLFWVGTMRRIGEYGLTEPRVWLVVCGGLMTLCVLLFLGRRSGRYCWVALAGFVVFAAVAYVPAFRPRRVAVHSQLNHAVRLAERLQLLDDEGALRLEAFRQFDTVLKADYRRFYEAAEYVSRYDSVGFRHFGVKMSDIRDAVPENVYDYVVYGWDIPVVEVIETGWTLDAPAGFRVPQIGNYSVVYTHWKSWGEDAGRYGFAQDTLHIYFRGEQPDVVISGDDLLEALLRQAGFDPSTVPSDAEIRAAKDKLLVYRDKDLAIVFSSLQFERDDASLRLAGVSIDAVLTR